MKVKDNKIIANVCKNKQPVKCYKPTWLYADAKIKQTFQNDNIAVGVKSTETLQTWQTLKYL